MIEKDLIHKLGKLREIKPSNEFAAVSKLIILNTGEHALSSSISLAQKLSHLKRLAPRAHFAAVSRELILNRGGKSKTTLAKIFQKSFNYGLAVGMAAVFMALITSVGYLNFLSPIPSDIYVKNLADADDAIKDIDIHLQQAEYFAAIDPKTSLALQESSTTDNPLLIESESQKTDFKEPSNKDIDDLLNKAAL